MAYKRTGRPPGRPKTKEYTTVLARLPQELADLVKRYAAERGQLPVSELIREGLEWRIGDGDPRGMGMYLSQPTGIKEKEYNSNTGIAIGSQGDEALQEVRALLARQGEQIQALAHAFERQTGTVQSPVSSSNTGGVLAVGPSDREAGPGVKSDKASVIARIRRMHDTGVDSRQIAAALQSEGLPTLSGKGVWQGGTVRKLLRATGK